MQVSQRIESIECLRGVSALLVVFYHYRFFLNDVVPDLGHMLFENGRMGVDVFFIISGFVIHLSTHAAHERRVVPFLVRRFFRVVPLAWVLIGLTYMLSPEVAFRDLVKSLLFIPLSHKDAPFFGYNILTPAWTLMYELCFYAVFSLGLWVVPRHRGWGVMALVLLMVFGLQWVAGSDVTVDTYDAAFFETLYLGPWWVGFLSNPLFLEFLIGVGFAQAYLGRHGIFKKIPENIRRIAYSFLFVLFLSHFFSGAAMGHGVDRKGLAAAVLFALCLAMHCDPVLRRLKDCVVPGPGGMFAFLGKISFSLYIVHEFLHVFVARIPGMNSLYEHTGGLGKFVILLSFSVFFSYLLYLAVEMPNQKLGKRLSNLSGFQTP